MLCIVVLSGAPIIEFYWIKQFHLEFHAIFCVSWIDVDGVDTYSFWFFILTIENTVICFELTNIRSAPIFTDIALTSVHYHTGEWI